MAGHARSRTKIEQLGGLTGLFTDSFLHTSNTLTNYDTATSVCADVVGNVTADWLGLLVGDPKARRKVYNPNGLSLIKDVIRYGSFSATAGNRKWKGYPGLHPGTCPTAPLPSGWGIPQSQSLAILAHTNPAAPHVSVPTQIAETLGELPSMLRNIGRAVLRPDSKIAKRWLQSGVAPYRSHAQSIGSTHLTVSFGISPLLGMLEDLMTLHYEVDKLLVQLHQLRKYGFTNVSTSLGSDISTVLNSSNYLLFAQGAFVIRARRYLDYQASQWGSAQYYTRSDTILPPKSTSFNYSKPGWVRKYRSALYNRVSSHRDERDTDFNPSTYDRMWAERQKLGFRWYEGVAAAWELLPWTWLSDWFFKTGTRIQAWNNSIGLGVRNICLMRELTTTARFEILPTSSPTDGIFLPVGSRSSKNRYVLAYPGPLDSITVLQPFLSLKKMDIITALVAQKGLLD